MQSKFSISAMTKIFNQFWLNHIWTESDRWKTFVLFCFDWPGCQQKCHTYLAELYTALYSLDCFITIIPCIIIPLKSLQVNTQNLFDFGIWVNAKTGIMVANTYALMSTMHFTNQNDVHIVSISIFLPEINPVFILLYVKFLTRQSWGKSKR